MINAYLYPTLEQLDAALDPHNHISPDDTEAYFPAPDKMTEVDRIVRDTFAELLGIPKEAIVVSCMKEKVRDVDRFIPNAPDEFVWRSHDGKQYNLSDMATPHIFYSLRMIYNHTVAPAFRVLRPGETMNFYPDVPHWDADYRREACDAFVAELDERDDLPEDLERQYADMKANARVITALGL